VARDAADQSSNASKAHQSVQFMQRPHQLAALAERQGGHVMYAQLIALGLTRRAVANLVARGSLIRVFRGVYAVGHLATTPVDRAQAALLVAGPRSVLSHGSAATLWGIWERWDEPFEITIADNRRPSGLRVHHSRTLTLADVTTERGLRVTSPARTIVDVAPRLSDRRLARAINDLRLRRLLSLEALQRLTDRLPHRPGAKRVRALIGVSGREPTRSTFEDDWIRFAARHRLPDHEMNVHVGGHRVDVLFIPDRLIVELDGWATHSTRQAFSEDRARDAEILSRTGIPTIRITHDGLHHRPLEQARLIRRIVRLARW
jgi:very-short-patch-repair endonuclease